MVLRIWEVWWGEREYILEPSFDKPEQPGTNLQVARETPTKRLLSCRQAGHGWMLPGTPRESRACWYAAVRTSWVPVSWGISGQSSINDGWSLVVSNSTPVWVCPAPHPPPPPGESPLVRFRAGLWVVTTCWFIWYGRWEPQLQTRKD